MKIVNFGSLCIDNVYAVPYFVAPGETLPCTDFQIHPGGKGLNQSLALANAGAEVWHAGKVGKDGIWLKELLADSGVNTDLLEVIDAPSGHANIQVTPQGQNAIVLYGGANKMITVEDVGRIIGFLEDDDCLLLQNEISCMPEILERAGSKRMTIVLNAAPMSQVVLDSPLENVGVFIINELEGQALSGAADPEQMLDRLIAKYPDSAFVLTLGESGAIFCRRNERISQQAYKVVVADTTGAGDTFTGFFLAAFLAEKPITECLDIGCRAAAVCVTRSGAATSIPREDEIWF